MRPGRKPAMVLGTLSSWSFPSQSVAFFCLFHTRTNILSLPPSPRFVSTVADQVTLVSQTPQSCHRPSLRMPPTWAPHPAACVHTYLLTPGLSAAPPSSGSRPGMPWPPPLPSPLVLLLSLHLFPPSSSLSFGCPCWPQGPRPGCSLCPGDVTRLLSSRSPS